VTVASVADPAAVEALAVAAAEVAAFAARLALSAGDAAVAAPAVLQATTPAMSTADPARSARIPIAHRSISCAEGWYRATSGARAAEQSGIAISARLATLCDHDNVSIRVGL
jgi:hypothetical protein